ncbi:MAG: hypothetical protein COA44_04135 [Arcobacter sp.]|nr:MAG: hypothetical protein COA44_04135 [Arcobacter sp.]
MKKLFLLLCSTALIVWATSLYINGIKKMLDADEDFFLIDIRASNQVEWGEIYWIDSFMIPRGYLEFRVEFKIPNKNAKIILYCCSGKRSILAAKSLMDMGYTNVAHLHGGIREWVEQDLPLDTTYGEMHRLEEPQEE